MISESHIFRTNKQQWRGYEGHAGTHPGIVRPLKQGWVPAGKEAAAPGAEGLRPNLSKPNWQILSGAGGLTARVPTATLSVTCGRRWCWRCGGAPRRTQRPSAPRAFRPKLPAFVTLTLVLHHDICVFPAAHAKQCFRCRAKRVHSASVLMAPNPRLQPPRPLRNQSTLVSLYIFQVVIWLNLAARLSRDWTHSVLARAYRTSLTAHCVQNRAWIIPRPLEGS